jgi:hypothetical protein
MKGPRISSTEEYQIERAELLKKLSLKQQVGNLKNLWQGLRLIPAAFAAADEYVEQYHKYEFEQLKLKQLEAKAEAILLEAEIRRNQDVQ